MYPPETIIQQRMATPRCELHSLHGEPHLYTGETFKCSMCGESGYKECMLDDFWEERYRDNIFLCRSCYDSLAIKKETTHGRISVCFLGSLIENNHSYNGSAYTCEECKYDGCKDCMLTDAWKKRCEDGIFLCKTCCSQCKDTLPHIEFPMLPPEINQTIEDYFIRGKCSLSKETHLFWGVTYKCENCRKKGCKDCMIDNVWEERCEKNCFLCKQCHEGAAKPLAERGLKRLCEFALDGDAGHIYVGEVYDCVYCLRSGCKECLCEKNDDGNRCFQCYKSARGS